MDLDWLFAHADQHHDYVVSVHELFARTLSLPLVTVAALQGHTFAAGALFSLAHDFRVMRADRGYWCLPEADIDIPFTPGMAALIQARLAPQAAHRAMVTAHRYGGTDAAAVGIVDRAVAEDAVRTTAFELAQAQVGKAGDTLGTIKARMYGPAPAVLRDTATPSADAEVHGDPTCTTPASAGRRAVRGAACARAGQPPAPALPPSPGGRAVGRRYCPLVAPPEPNGRHGA
jgi:enoyl-CoA hydratase/carnithine racemase